MTWEEGKITKSEEEKINLNEKMLGVKGYLG